MNVYSQIERVDKLYDMRGENCTASDLRKELYTLVRSFLLQGGYTQYKNREVILKRVFLPAADIAEQTGLSAQGITMAKMRMSRDALCVTGEDVFGVLEYGDESKVKTSLRDFAVISKGWSARDLIPFELIKTVKETADNSKVFEISDCKREMALLHWLSLLKYEAFLDGADRDKVGYLLRVLNGEIGSANERARVMRWVCAENLADSVSESDKDKTAFPFK